ncbi:hypothetical protein ACWDYA_14185, partial [Micrococcus luteus]
MEHALGEGFQEPDSPQKGADRGHAGLDTAVLLRGTLFLIARVPVAEGQFVTGIRCRGHGSLPVTGEGPREHHPGRRLVGVEHDR